MNPLIADIPPALVDVMADAADALDGIQSSVLIIVMFSVLLAILYKIDKRTRS